MKRKLVGILVALVLALVGTVSLVGYVEKAKNDAIEDDAQVTVLVVQRDIPAGATLAIIGNAVVPTEVPKRLVSPDALTSLDNVDPTLVAGVDLKAGEQLLASRLVDADDLVRVEVPEGLQEITLALDPERAVGGALAPGELVGILLSFDSEDPEAAGVTTTTDDTQTTDGEPLPRLPKTTHLTLSQILVTAVQYSFTDTQRTAQPPTTDENGDIIPGTTVATAPASVLLVTLAVTTPQAEQITFAAEFGLIWLTRQNADTDLTGGSILTLDKVYGVVKE
ncbi:MAG: Flp pilus assembly protein CpaB [Ilumatobacteraceae bacterium]